MTLKSESSRLIALQVKSALYTAFCDSEYTEEDIARTVGVSQQYVSQVMNPHHERQVPLWFLAKLPKPIAHILASSVLRHNGLDVRDLSKPTHVNGSIFDEMRHMMEALGGIAKRAELIPENVAALRKLAGEMERTLEQFKSELDAAEARP